MHTEFCKHAVNRQRRFAHRIFERNVFINQLRHIFIAGGNNHMMSVRGGITR